MWKIYKEVLPFAAQLIGNILRAMGWTLDITTHGKPTPPNSVIRAKLEELNEKLNKSNNNFVEEGRLRLEGTKGGRVIKVFLFLGNLKRTDTAKAGTVIPEPETNEPTFGVE